MSTPTRLLALGVNNVIPGLTDELLDDFGPAMERIWKRCMDQRVLACKRDHVIAELQAIPGRQYDGPRFALTVAQLLNRGVALEWFKRVEGKFYLPGPKCEAD